KNGKRLRYYISHRLVKDRSRKHPDAWRLPAEQLEGLIADLVRKHLHRHDGATRLLRDLAASEVAEKSTMLGAVQQTNHCLHLIDRVDLSPGTLTVHLSSGELTQVLECDTDRIREYELTLTSPFRMRRRGVELKLHLGDASPEVDRTLVHNIVKAQKWMSMIIGGKTSLEIAQAEGTSKRRVQDVVDLAMLAPDILDAIVGGEQPDGLTSDTIIKSGVPAEWSEQRKLFAKL
ncbi:MAG: recombinase family protein, partial [Roseobacter sp.]